MPYYAPAYQQEIAVLPTYGLGYYPTDTNALTLIEEVKLMRQAVERLSASGGVLGLAHAEPPHVAVLRQHCASCHSAPGAKGNLAMFEAGKLAPLRFEQWDSVFKALREKRMPPGPTKLDYDQLATVVTGVMEHHFSSKEK